MALSYWKGQNIRNIYAKYERPTSHSEEVMANGQKKLKGHGRGHTFKIYGPVGNALSQGTHMLNIYSLL